MNVIYILNTFFNLPMYSEKSVSFWRRIFLRFT